MSHRYPTLDTMSPETRLSLRVSELFGGNTIAKTSADAWLVGELPRMMRAIFGADVKFTIECPTVWPHECINGAVNKYAANLIFTRGDKVISVYIPTIVGSMMCQTYGRTMSDIVAHGGKPNDVGGYFIGPTGGEICIRMTEHLHPCVMETMTETKQAGARMGKRSIDPAPVRVVEKYKVKRDVDTNDIYVTARKYLDAKGFSRKTEVFVMDYPAQMEKILGRDLHNVATVIITQPRVSSGGNLVVRNALGINENYITMPIATLMALLIYSSNGSLTQTTVAVQSRNRRMPDLNLATSQRKAQPAPQMSTPSARSDPEITLQRIWSIIDVVTEVRYKTKVRAMLQESITRGLVDHTTVERCIEHNGQVTRIREILDATIPDASTIEAKLYGLAMLLVAHICDRINFRVTDLDDYTNKIYYTAGRQIYSKLAKLLVYYDVSTRIDPRGNEKFVRQQQLRKMSLFKCFSITANYGYDKKTIESTHIQLDHMSRFGDLMMTRSIIVPTSSHAAEIARVVRLESQIGYVDPYYTSDSAKVGFDKDLGVNTTISLPRLDAKSIILSRDVGLGVVSLGTDVPAGHKLLCIDGTPVGFVLPQKFEEVRRMLLRGYANHFTRQPGALTVLQTGNVATYDLSFARSETRLDIFTEGGILGTFMFVAGTVNRDETGYDGVTRPAERVGELIIDTIGNWQNMSPTELIQRGALAFVSVKECARYTESPAYFRRLPYTGRPMYSQITPTAMFGYATASMVFVNCTYGSRVIFDLGLKSQYMSMDSSNTMHTNKKIKLACRSQQALCSTPYAETWRKDCHATQTLMTAFIIDPDNYEDAFVLSRETAAERLQYMVFSTTKITVKPDPEGRITYHVGICSTAKMAKFGAIDPSTGLPKIGARIAQGDAIFAKYRRVYEDNRTSFAEIDDSIYATVDNCSVINKIWILKWEVANSAARHTVTKTDVLTGAQSIEELSIKQLEEIQPLVRGQVPFMHRGSYVFSNYMSTPNTAPFLRHANVRIQMAEFRSYRHGDKLACSISQKGTTGNIVPRGSLPYVIEGANKGMRPDILFSPAGFPSRQTGGMMREILSSIMAAVTGKIQDGSAFGFEDLLEGPYGDTHIRDVYETIRQHPHYMLNSMAQKMRFELKRPDGHIEYRDVDVLIAPLAWGIIKHSAADKTKVYESDPMRRETTVSRQPAGGRHGGLSIGIQELSALTSANATSILSERTKAQSDGMNIIVCTVCGLRLSAVAPGQDPRICPNCRNPTVIVATRYATELLKLTINMIGMDLQYGVTKKT